MLKRDLGVGAALVIALVILLSVNLSGSVVLRNVKLDLTEDRLYTLSKGSRAMLGELDEAVKVKIFFSKRPAGSLPVIKQYADRTVELLRQFVNASKGKLTLEVLEPRPDTEVEEWAVKYGLRAVPVNGDEPLYLGLVAESETGEERSIPFLDPQRESYLEYDIARLIEAISRPKKRVIGLLSPLKLGGGMPDDPMARFQGAQATDPWVFVNELRQTYEVRELSATAGEIEKGVDLLLVVHPKNLPEQTEYAIDQFVLKGGNAIILADPLCEFDQMNNRDPNPQSRFQATFDSNLPKLFKAWGLEFSKDKVVADDQIGAQVNTGQRVERYIPWLMLGPESCNKEEIVSSDLERLTFATAGVFKKVEGAKFNYTPLIETPETSGEIDGFMLKFGPQPDQLRKDFKPGSKKLALAYKITGDFETAFPEGKPKSSLPKTPDEAAAEPKPDEDPMKDHVAKAEAGKAGTVIVVGDVDMLSDRFSVDVKNFFGQRLATLINDNFNFMNNAVEMLTGSSNLISLRTRGKSARPFTTVDALERKAGEKWKSEEDALQKRIDDTNNKLRELQSGKGEGESRTVLSKEQMAEIERLRKEVADGKKRLREVRRNLRQDIESLGARLKFVNIALLPILITMMSFMPSAWRSHRVRSTRG